MKDDDLKFYLFEEHIKTLKNIYPGYNYKLSKNTENFLRLSVLIKLLSKFLRFYFNILKLFKFKKKRKLILFHDQLVKYTSILNETDKKENIIIFGNWLSPFIYSLKNNIPYYPLHDVFIDLYNSYQSEDFKLMKKSIINLKRKLKILDPDLIVLNHDHYPETRAIILVANELNIPTVEIQHGIYQKSIPIITGNYVDYVFVWGDYFRKLYGLHDGNKQVQVLGYPYTLKNDRPSHKIGKVYYYGQPYENYYSEVMKVKIETVNFLKDLCDLLGLQFIYRPHQGENLSLLKSKLPSVMFKSSETLTDSIKNGDIFISFNSTALIEAAIHSKVSIQLKNLNIETDNFEELGICKTLNNLEEIDEFLKIITTVDDLKIFYKPIDPNYIEIPDPNPGVKFYEMINDLL